MDLSGDDNNIDFYVLFWVVLLEWNLKWFFFVDFLFENKLFWIYFFSCSGKTNLTLQFSFEILNLQVDWPFSFKVTIFFVHGCRVSASTPKAICLLGENIIMILMWNIAITTYLPNPIYFEIQGFFSCSPLSLKNFDVWEKDCCKMPNFDIAVSLCTTSTFTPVAR